MSSSVIVMYYLEFSATQIEPQLDVISRVQGGCLSSAAARHEIDFAVTGSSHSVFGVLRDDAPSRVKIEFPADQIMPTPGETNFVNIPDSVKLLGMSTRLGASINGTTVSTVAGQSSTPVSQLFKYEHGVTSIPLVYSHWQSHSSSLSIADACIVDASGVKMKAHFIPCPADVQAASDAAEELVGRLSTQSWELRQKTLIFHQASGLTKVVGVVPLGTGINGSGMEVMANLVDTKLPYSWGALNSMYQHAISIELQLYPECIKTFETDTLKPGLLAAKHAPAVAAATSLLVNWLCAYRFDGKSVVSIHGVLHIEVENWQHACPRSPVEGGDCDNSATKAKAMLQTIADASNDVISEYSYLKSIKNVIVPYFTVGLGIVGATSSEASNLSEQNVAQSTVAGHAVTFMIPTLQLLHARELAMGVEYDGGKDKDKGAVMEASFKALFPSEILNTLPPGEKSKLDTWTNTSHLYNGGNFANDLHALASEGTSWTSSIIYMEPGKERADVEKLVVADNAVFSLLGPNIGVGLKILHVGGQDPENPHRFISPGIVELTLGSKSALWTDPTLRTLGAACSQLVLSPGVHTAGVTPRGLWEGKFAAIPLYSASSDEASILDFASAMSLLDVLPPRAGVYQLSAFDTKSLKHSMSSLDQLAETFRSRTADVEIADSHIVTYILSYSSLIFNPAAVEHTCRRLNTLAIDGVVDVFHINGLAIDCEGKQAGILVHISVRVRHSQA